MPEAEINTTTRWSQYCRATASDGRVCFLYSPHDGKHRPKHGLEKDEWSDGE